MAASTALPPASRTWPAVIALFAVTVIWGGTFVWMKQGLEASAAVLGAEHSTVGVALFMGLRFGLSALFLAVCVPSARRGLTRGVWSGGLWLGGLLFIGFVLQMYGLEEVTPAVSAFLTSLYVLFTALITAFASRRGLGPALGFGVVLATLGAGFIRGRPELAFNVGELLTLICALVFAVHILATDRITRRVAALPVTLSSFVVVAAGSAVLYAFGSIPDPPARSAIAALLTSPAFLVPLALSTLLATVVALTLMNVYQRELDPVRAAILYALEPIWAALFGVLSGHNALDHYLWIGGSLLLAGNLVAEIGQQRRSRAAVARHPDSEAELG